MTITRIFWILFTVEALAMVVIGVSLASKGNKGWGPEGPVGAWIVFIPPVFLALMAAVVLIFRTDHVKVVATGFLCLPLIQIAIGPVYSAWQNYQTDRSLAGDDTFVWPAQRKLAHAIRAHDAASVKSLIPGAGDINAQHKGDTLLWFALVNVDTSSASHEIVKLLLDSGANPNVGAGSGTFPLTLAIPQPEVTEMLLKAGADPNRLDDAKRPVWWGVLSSDTDEGLRTLRILLDHGADLTKRDGEGGPVAWAAYHAFMSHSSKWRIVWMLMERGAAWKNEQEFGRTVDYMFRSTFEEIDHYKHQISDEMRKLMAKLEEQAAQ